MAWTASLVWCQVTDCQTSSVRNRNASASGIASTRS